MRRLLIVAAGTGALVLLPAVAASAHPLGNFTVNHYDGVTVHPDRVDVFAVVDAAEIPTAQAQSRIDANGDGGLDPTERARYAATTCQSLARDTSVTVDGAPLALSVRTTSYALRPGAAGLSTSRLECRLTGAADLTGANRRVAIADTYDAHRIGWHEVTASAAAGVHLVQSPVPARSVSDQLRRYPNDLLSSPLNVRSATLAVAPGGGPSTVAKGVGGVAGASAIARAVDRLNRFFSNLAGSRHLTLGVGLLAVAVSLLLGAAHAALPGHGKTVMAAYIAGKRGSTRDAVLVGATVTATHTAGVIVLGLALSLSSSLAGDRVEGELGVTSGALVAAIGVGLLISALRRRHGNGHDDDHGHAHDHGHSHEHGHSHQDGHGHSHDHARRSRRAGLVGMGVAGGLVPSPSALVVLLGAAALGRTAFGVLLVLTYGIGMAATLTAAGLLAVRLSRRWAGGVSRLRITARLAGATPIVTGGLVVVVGLGLAARSLAVV